MNRGIFPGWNRTANGVMYPSSRLVVSGAFAASVNAGAEFSGSLTVDGGLWPYRASLSGSPPPELNVSPVLVDGARWKIAAAGYGATGGTYNFNVIVVSADGQSVTAAQTVQVQSPIVPWDSATKGTNITLTNGNTTATKTTSNAHSAVIGTVAKSSGKWYFEVHVDTAVSTDGIIIGAEKVAPGSTFVGAPTYGFGYYQTGQKINASTTLSFGSSYTTGDVIGVAIDATAQKIWFAKNNTWQASGDPSAGTNEAFSTAMAPSIYPAASVYYGTGDAVTIRSRAAEFSYSPPSGFTEWASP